MTDTETAGLTCMDCGRPADVFIGGKGLCAEHYAKRASNMRRNRGGLVFENNVYREPTDDERRVRARIDFQRWRARFQKATSEPAAPGLNEDIFQEGSA